jgi:hypothetical protein
MLKLITMTSSLMDTNFSLHQKKIVIIPFLLQLHLKFISIYLKTTYGLIMQYIMFCFKRELDFVCFMNCIVLELKGEIDETLIVCKKIRLFSGGFSQFQQLQL